MTTPTATRIGTPTTCFCCNRQAIPIGVGDAKEPKYLCAQCVEHLAEIRRIQRFSPFEHKAVEAAGEKAGALLDQWNKTDLAVLDPEEWRLFLKTVIEEFGRDLRRQFVANEAPF